MEEEFREAVPEGPALGQATIHLADAGVTDLATVIKVDEVDAFDLPTTVGFEGRLYVQRRDAEVPEWARQLEQLLGTSLDGVRSQSPAAALVVRVAGRVFALTFGLGRHLLVAERFVDDFGLRVAANTISPREVRAVDGRTFGRGVLHTRRQTSRPGRVETLGVQLDREMLGSITGRSRTPGHGRVHGSTSLGVTRPIVLGDLEALGSELLDAYASTDYREAFSLLDRMRPLPRTSEVVRDLDRGLEAALGAPDLRGAYLAAPAILDWENVSGFRYSTDPRGTTRDDIELRDYLLAVGPGNATLDRLRADRVRLVARDSSRATTSWPVYRCIVWEEQRDDGAYILSEGRWWRVDTAYLQAVNAMVARVGQSQVAMPTPSRADLDEPAYSSEAAAAIGGIVLDRLTARIRTERGGFELCDIFLPPDRLIHVKRGFGAQELSHLFNQGTTSAEGVRNAREVRERLKSLVAARDAAAAETLPTDRRPHADEFEVVFAIVTGSPARVPDRLPFFARAALARAVQTLIDLDFRVSAIGIGTRAQA